ncbi:DUF4296 domain-containing protein [Sphingobacterium suaedae]|uniref:DUF4296 domain-containing protein n=1 Tax=Sphingobacterium suaedae TaxID=1686402 RepID=A0ABW5KHS8_9SPHI
MPFCKFVQTYKMQRLLLVILSSFFLWIGCKKSTPKGILPQKVMVDLLTEVHLVDGYLNNLPVDSTRRIIGSLYGELFDKYKIDSTVFKQNVAYYLGDPVSSKELYAAVTKKLTDYDREFRVADSVQNARISDSIRIVQHYTKLREDARRLILDVHVDTIPLSHRTYRTDFMDRAGLTVNVYEPQATSTAIPTVQQQQQQQPAPTENKELKPATIPQRIPRPELKPKPLKEVQADRL